GRASSGPAALPRSSERARRRARRALRRSGAPRSGAAFGRSDAHTELCTRVDVGLAEREGDEGTQVGLFFDVGREGGSRGEAGREDLQRSVDAARPDEPEAIAGLADPRAPLVARERFVVVVAEDLADLSSGAHRELAGELLGEAHDGAIGLVVMLATRVPGMEREQGGGEELRERGTAQSGGEQRDASGERQRAPEGEPELVGVRVERAVVRDDDGRILTVHREEARVGVAVGQRERIEPERTTVDQRGLALAEPLE